MAINRNVLATIMLYRICRHVNSDEVITIETNWYRQRDTKIIQKLAHLDCLSKYIPNSSIFSLGRRLRNGRLLLGMSGYDIGTEKHNISCSGATWVLTACPISIGIRNNQGWRTGRSNPQTMLKRALQMAKCTIDSVELINTGSMHKLRNYMHYIRNVR